VYPALIILTPIHIYITRCFYIIRNNYEMRVLEPNVIILMSLLIWIRLIFESVYQLTLNLDAEVWNDHQTTSWVFNMLNWFCCILIFGLYFFRVWMFWYKTVKARKASIFVENDANRSGSSINQVWDTPLSPKPNRCLRNQRKIVAMSIFSVFIWTTLLGVVHFAMDCHDCVQRYHLSLIALLPFILISFLLLRRVNNHFGVISEFRVVIVLVFINFGLNVLLVFFPGWEESYWRTLIDYLFRAVWLCSYLLWLLCSIRKFDVDHKKSGFSLCDLLKSWSTKWGWCCKNSISEWHWHAPIIKDLNLPDILREQELFNYFETM